MTQDGFLTLVALVLAGLGFLPAERRLHFRATLLRGLVITIPAFALILYFEFYAAVQLACPSLFGSLCEHLAMTEDSPFGPRDAAFAIVVLWAAVIWLAYQKEGIGPAALPGLKNIVAELLQKREHMTLVDLLEPNLDLIERAAARKLRLQRWYDWWAARRAKPFKRLRIRLDGKKIIPERRTSLATARSWGRRATGVPGLILPAQRDAEGAAHWIRDRLFADAAFRHHLVKERPGFGARLATGVGHQAGDFADLFLADLAADTGSSLYREIERWGGASPLAPANFDDGFPLLAALLNDASIMVRMEGWRPIGEHFLSRIRPGNDPAYVASLNRRPDRLWDERGRHDDTAFMTVSFFDLMVTSAALQGVPSHMWLMYTDHFTRALLAIHDETGADIDRTAEWPTRGSEILYRIVRALTGWVALFRRLPEDGFHRKIERMTLDDGEARIPKSALISLAVVTRAVLLAPNVNDDFKDYIFAIAMRCASELPTTGRDAGFRKLLISGLAGATSTHRAADYAARASRSFLAADFILQAQLGELEKALQAAQPVRAMPSALATPRPKPPEPRSLWKRFRQWLGETSFRFPGRR